MKTAPINAQINKGGLSKQQLNFTKFLLKSLTYLTAGIMAITSLALAYVPLYCALILTPLLPTRLSSRLISWLVAEQGGA